MKNYYGDVEVIIRSKIRVNCECKGQPTEKELLKALNKKAAKVEIIDIMDEEHLEYQKILDMSDLNEQEE